MNTRIIICLMGLLLLIGCGTLEIGVEKPITVINESASEPSPTTVSEPTVTTALMPTSEPTLAPQATATEMPESMSISEPTVPPLPTATETPKSTPISEPTAPPLPTATETPKSTPISESTIPPLPTATETPISEPIVVTQPAENGSTNDEFVMLATEIKAVVVVADEAKLYAGPGEQYGEVGGMFGGLPIPVNGISEDGKWYHAHCPDAPDPTSCDYWVSADANVVQPKDELPQHRSPAQPSEEFAILPTDVKAVVVVAVDKATLYAGPGEQYGEVGGMFGGLAIPIDGISQDGKWYHAHCPDAPDPTSCDYWVSTDPNVVQPLAELPQHGVPPQDDNASMLLEQFGPVATYINEEVGFTIDYPASWSVTSQVIGPRGSQTQFTSWDHPEGEFVEEIPEGGSLLTLNIALWDPKDDLDRFVAMQRQILLNSGDTILEESEWTLAHGLRVIRLRVQPANGQVPFPVWYTTTGQRYLILSANGNLQIPDLMARTLRPVRG